MVDHATIFFCKGYSYLLCYDEDIEPLANPTRSRMPTHKLKPFILSNYDAGMLNKTYVMRIIYKPVKTKFGRRPDNFVDRYVVVTSEWLKRMAMQFEAVFPAGLDDDLLMKATNVDFLT